jgi:hypothetical protein
MSISEKQAEVSINAASVKGYSTSTRNADDAVLADLGYKAEFRREFSVGCYLPASMRSEHSILSR